ncbi:unnamed protein product [Nezara viridula]|uniref:Uncharacterized protein n=1 Tax=Nezara viridula TaxID=85310 RepID=A0A9P0HJM4_NEZVI|nr:unnamed protein product [Nezara viridula]
MVESISLNNREFPSPPQTSSTTTDSTRRASFSRLVIMDSPQQASEEAGRYLGVFVARRADMWPMVTIPLDPIFIGHRVKRTIKGSKTFVAPLGSSVLTCFFNFCR